jgi:hypothetical protein
MLSEELLTLPQGPVPPNVASLAAQTHAKRSLLAPLLCVASCVDALAVLRAGSSFFQSSGGDGGGYAPSGGAKVRGHSRMWHAGGPHYDVWFIKLAGEWVCWCCCWGSEAVLWLILWGLLHVRKSGVDALAVLRAGSGFFQSSGADAGGYAPSGGAKMGCQNSRD